MQIKITNQSSNFTYDFDDAEEYKLIKRVILDSLNNKKDTLTLSGPKKTLVLPYNFLSNSVIEFID